MIIPKNEINITMLGECGGQEIGLLFFHPNYMKNGNSVISAQPYQNDWISQLAVKTCP